MLTEVFRQKGGSPIIENALRINSGNVDLKECPDFQIIQTKMRKNRWKNHGNHAEML